MVRRVAQQELRRAVREGSRELIALALARGASLGGVEYVGDAELGAPSEHVFHCSAAWGVVASLEHLLALEGHDLLDDRDWQGDTALHVAVSHLCPETVAALIASGAAVAAMNKAGRTPMDALLGAARRGAARGDKALRVLRLLAAAGAAPPALAPPGTAKVVVDELVRLSAAA